MGTHVPAWACTSTLGNRVASGGTVLNSTSASVIAVSCPPNTDVWLECSEDEKEATLAAPPLPPPPPPSPLFDGAMFTMFIPLPTDPLEDEQKISLEFQIVEKSKIGNPLNLSLGGERSKLVNFLRT